MFKYIVQPTDTLHFIALKFNIPVKELMYTNNLTDPHQIGPGQSLIVPNISNTDQGRLPLLFPGCANGSFVILLQSQLSKLDYYGGEIDGAFNCMTHRAVRSFQIDSGLSPSGVVDQYTWVKLFENVDITYDLPNYKARLIPPGMLIILSTDRNNYMPKDIMTITLLNVNLTAKPLMFTYDTDQRYDFAIDDSNKKNIWQWSGGRSFPRDPGSICLPPFKTISHTEHLNLSALAEYDNSKDLRLTGWNTPFQTHRIKMQLPFTILGQS